jgi:type II secretory pathway component PulK
MQRAPRKQKGRGKGNRVLCVLCVVALMGAVYADLGFSAGAVIW